MTLALITAALAGILLLAGLILARRPPRPWASDNDTRLVVAVPPQSVAPQLRLMRGDRPVFGPVGIAWTAQADAAVALGNPGRDPALAGGDVPPGDYVVLAGVDLSGTTRPIRAVLGPQALLLRPANTPGGRDILLHGRGGNSAFSPAGGLSVEAKVLRQLLLLLGDPRGLRVEITAPRQIRRGGWGRPAP